LLLTFTRTKKKSDDWTKRTRRDPQGLGEIKARTRVMYVFLASDPFGHGLPGVIDLGVCTVGYVWPGTR
jgi:hypothetical protein